MGLAESIHGTPEKPPAVGRGTEEEGLRKKPEKGQLDRQKETQGALLSGKEGRRAPQGRRGQWPHTEEPSRLSATDWTRCSLGFRILRSEGIAARWVARKVHGAGSL